MGNLALKMKNAKLPGGENLLDRTLITWGSGISKGNAHFAGRNYQVLIGRGGGAFKPGVRASGTVGAGKSMMNLWLTVLHGFGIDRPTFGEDSTGKIAAILA